MILGVFLSQLSDESRKYPLAIVKACSWGIGRFPIIRIFLSEELTNYGNQITVDYRAGGSPRISFLDSKGQEIELIDISSFTRDQIVQLLASKNIVSYLNRVSEDPISEDL